jgi:hypothetical protein
VFPSRTVDASLVVEEDENTNAYSPYWIVT